MTHPLISEPDPGTLPHPRRCPYPSGRPGQRATDEPPRGSSRQDREEAFGGRSCVERAAIESFGAGPCRSTSRGSVDQHHPHFLASRIPMRWQFGHCLYSGSGPKASMPTSLSQYSRSSRSASVIPGVADSREISASMRAVAFRSLDRSGAQAAAAADASSGRRRRRLSGRAKRNSLRIALRKRVGSVPEW